MCFVWSLYNTMLCYIAWIGIIWYDNVLCLCMGQLVPDTLIVQWFDAPLISFQHSIGSHYTLLHSFTPMSSCCILLVPPIWGVTIIFRYFVLSMFSWQIYFTRSTTFLWIYSPMHKDIMKIFILWIEYYVLPIWMQ